MGGQSSTLQESFGRLVESTNVIGIQEDSFWEQLWSNSIVSLDQWFELATADVIRNFKKNCPKNLATLCRRAVLKLNAATNTGVANAEAQSQVSNVVRLLTRLIPFVYEDPAWDGFWWTPTPVGVVISMVNTPPPTNAFCLCISFSCIVSVRLFVF